MKKHMYEIYTKNPTTGENGWEIKWVLSTPESIHSYPNFDCIISVDDYAGAVNVANWF